MGKAHTHKRNTKVKNEVFGSRHRLAAARCKGSKRATYIKFFVRLPRLQAKSYCI